MIKYDRNKAYLTNKNISANVNEIYWEDLKSKLKIKTY
jgi:hypothetical protein